MQVTRQREIDEIDLRCQLAKSFMNSSKMNFRVKQKKVSESQKNFVTPQSSSANSVVSSPQRRRSDTISGEPASSNSHNVDRAMGKRNSFS